MPGYLKKADQLRIGEGLAKVSILNSNELAYAIQRLTLQYLEPRPMDDYSLAEALGAIEVAKLEFVTRVVDKFHTHKIQSGDHYHEFIRSKNI